MAAFGEFTEREKMKAYYVCKFVSSCCCLPCILDTWKEVVHYCSNCHQVIGVNDRIDRSYIGKDVWASDSDSDDEGLDAEQKAEKAKERERRRGGRRRRSRRRPQRE